MLHQKHGGEVCVGGGVGEDAHLIDAPVGRTASPAAAYISEMTGRTPKHAGRRSLPHWAVHDCLPPRPPSSSLLLCRSDGGSPRPREMERDLKSWKA